MTSLARRRPPRAGIRRWSLRARVLAVLVALLALVSVTVGVVTVVALRDQLVGQIDSELTSAGGRSVTAGGPPPGGPGGNNGNSGNGNGNGNGGNGNGDERSGARFLLAPGQAAGTLGARLDSSGVEAAAVLDEDGELQTLTPSAARSLTSVAADGRPHTITVATLGRFRVVATRTSDGEILLTGLPLSSVDRTVNRVIVIELIVAGGALLLAGVFGAWMVKRTLNPLHRVAATARRVSALPLARGEVAIAERIDTTEVDDRTEVGQVAGAVNRLLDHVDDALSVRQQSETKIRRFVADASHELRTPLTAIRGYAELSRRIPMEAPPELRHAMSRIESEAGRMTTMVEDLLLLARLDAGRELAAEPVDLTRLVLDAVSDATASGPEHLWRMGIPDDPIIVTGDAHSLHQVVVNLLANARTHTPSGTTVTTTLSVDFPDTASITVLDDGPGIPPEALPTVFERFTRGTTSRSRKDGSTGLGLAIVRAIVEAHNGQVRVTSGPGQTAFVVQLPLYLDGP